jgi:hypothetical protein
VERLAFENNPANHITVGIPTLWHPKLIHMRDLLKKRSADLEVSKKRRDEELLRRSKGRNPGPNWTPLTYSFIDEGGMLFSRHHSIPFRVTALTATRALQIVNALFYEAEKRACKVEFNKGDSRFTIKLEHAYFSMAIRERQEHDVVKRTGYLSSIGEQKVYKPTDKLALVVDKHPGGTFEIVDKDGRRLEDQLNEVFVRLYATVVATRVFNREEVVKETQRAASRAAYEALTKQRAVEAEAKAAEDKRRKSLLDEAASWRQAESIRAYASHVMSNPNVRLIPRALAWEAWALNVANAMDPTDGCISRFSSEPLGL